MENQLGKIAKQNDGYKVVFERLLKHPIEVVWDAITNPEQMKYWFTDIEMDFLEGGKMTIRYRDKQKTVSYGKIISIEPPYRFVWTWEDELAVWELRSVDNARTELRLTYSKLSSDYAINAPAGFHVLLDRLAARLDGSEAIHPFGTEEKDAENIKVQVHYAAIAYNDYPEIVKTKPVEVEKVYDAPVERVWKAITDKEQMKQWYFDLDKFKPEPGFQFRFAGEGHKGAKYMHVCTVTEIVPRKKLQYSWQYEGHPGYSLVTFELRELENRTRLKLTHHGLETFPQDSPDFAWKSFHAGWSEIIGTLLADFVEKE